MTWNGLSGGVSEFRALWYQLVHNDYSTKVSNDYKPKKHDSLLKLYD